MTANFLVGLREGLEAVLVVVLLMAYLRKVGRADRLPYMWAGIAAAVAVSAIFGAILTFGPRGLTFEAQEIIGGGLSIIAVGFVTWMVFFMARSARSMGADLRGRVDDALAAGGGALVLVAALAVGREGLETALFLWAATQAQSQSAGVGSPLVAALLGIAVAIGIGWLIHRGALKVNLGRFFTVTGFALILVAAGVLAYGVHDLQEAGVLPGLHALAFDVTAIVPPGSWHGTLLKGIFNFSPQTTWLEFAAWWAYAVPVVLLYARAVRPSRPSARLAPASASAPAAAPATARA
ncbi:iron uptake transporter permease EfeU [Falsarthrobacter nasiphocae]|uniref:High-affinity iron transporter n=1 Tax=Falsarthrobacter nasiphocae TaxID=189863 RepID=A0AAE3YFZ9_9MICC|nr:iron uptake transporter permease EfeU [Falsarthrobacter nasiphocae]MDR6892470.1 high-affinity iron transporter [Falsarthrobacter nasiphocae]